MSIVRKVDEENISNEGDNASDDAFNDEDLGSSVSYCANQFRSTLTHLQPLYPRMPFIWDIPNARIPEQADARDPMT
jgi:hypothetical protein